MSGVAAIGGVATLMATTRGGAELLVSPSELDDGGGSGVGSSSGVACGCMGDGGAGSFIL